MRTMRVIFWLAVPVGALLCGLSAVAAQDSPDARTACTPDAMRLCSDFIPDADRVKSCMMKKRAQLSDDCRTAMRGGGEHRRREAHYHHKRRMHCGRHGRHCG